MFKNEENRLNYVVYYAPLPPRAGSKSHTPLDLPCVPRTDKDAVMAREKEAEEKREGVIP
ncbi:MAG: hypothetical protein B6I38_11390 [Anaerolineaceae bacterium 4572_5.1]|nr:MAG: hypothetical protein B6I38_11390 [Anaerolineaceae bacterium 4572_5.1]